VASFHGCVYPCARVVRAFSLQTRVFSEASYVCTVRVHRARAHLGPGPTPSPPRPFRARGPFSRPPVPRATNFWRLVLRFKDKAKLDTSQVDDRRRAQPKSRPAPAHNKAEARIAKVRPGKAVEEAKRFGAKSRPAPKKK
jgi:hypothetical protein